jgi:DNA-binding transcriptional ArsR family regulator
MSLVAVSKHLKVLEKAGLISKGREAQWRPCRLEAKPLRQVDDWLESYRQFWNDNLDRLEDYAALLQKGGKNDPSN